MKKKFLILLEEIATNRKTVQRAQKEIEMLQKYAATLHAENKRLKEYAATLEKDIKRLKSENIVLQQRFEYAHTYGLAAAQTLGKIGGTIECGQEWGESL